ncbi:TPA: DNA-binding protein, partial [Yersinia enterocolitica]|nr:DNA-binding protein [Yersinia enterocolitica]
EPTGGAVDVRTELDVREKQFNTQAAVAIQTLRQGGSIRMSDSVRVLQDLNIIDPEAKPEEVEDELRNETIDLSRVPNEAIEIEE